MTWEDIAKKLSRKTLSVAFKGVQMLEELGDPAAVARALEGVHWGKHGYREGFVGSSLIAADNTDAVVNAILVRCLPMSPAAQALAATVPSLSTFRHQSGSERMMALLPCFTGLRTLSIRGQPVADLRWLAGMTALESLVLHPRGEMPDLTPLYDRPPLKRLSLQVASDHVWPDRPLPVQGSLLLLGGVMETLSAIPTLSELCLKKISGLTTLSALPAGLTRLTVESCPDLTTLGPLPTSLKVLRLQTLPALTDLGAHQQLPSLTELRLQGAPALTSLRGLPGSDRLPHLELRGLDGLTDLAGFPEMAGLVTLALPRCRGLTSLDGLPVLPKLEKLLARSCTALADLRALLQQPKLTMVSLEGCTGALDPAPLAQSTTIRAMGLHGSSIKRRDIPMSIRHRGSWASYVKLEEIRDRAPPAKVKQSPKQKRTLAQLRALLRSPEQEVVEQGLELLRAMDNPAWYDALLRGTTYTSTSWKSGLKGGTFVGHMKPYGLTALIAEAPGQCEGAKDLRARITDLRFKGLRADPARPLSPKYLAGLPALRKLDFERLGPILSQQPDWPQLEELTLRELLATEDLTWLSGAHNLKKLDLRRVGAVKLKGLGQVRSLEELEMWSCGAVSLAPLSGLPALRRISITGRTRVTDWQAVVPLPALTTLSVHRSAPEDVSLFRDSPLRTLTITDVVALSGLAQLTGLESLSLYRVPGSAFASLPPGLTSLSAAATLSDISGPLTRLKTLRRLRLRTEGGTLDDIPAVGGSLEHLSLEACALRSVAGLSAHPQLTELHLTLAPGADPAPILALPTLKKVRIQGARLDALEERGVEVTHLS